MNLIIYGNLVLLFTIFSTHYDDDLQIKEIKKQ